MSFKTIWEPDGVLWEFEGIVPFSDIQGANIQFYEDKRSDYAKYQLVDGRKIEQLILTESDLTELAALDAGASISIQKLKIAFVTEDPEVISLAQQYIDIALSLNSNWVFKFFKHMETARAWISSKR